MRKALAVILFILVTIGIGYGLYALFFRGPTGGQVNEPGEIPVNEPGGGLPPAQPGAPITGVPGEAQPLPPGVSAVADGGVTLVSPVAPVPTVGASISANGNVNFYNRTDGRFYAIGADGEMRSLSGKTFFNVSNAEFDPSGNKAIIEYPDGANVFYDFSTGTQVTLPAHWEDFDFNPTGTQIAAKSIATDEANRFLIVSGPDGAGAHAVQELGANADEVRVSWSPNNQVIASATTGPKLGVDRQEVYLLGQNQENFKSLVVEGLDFRSKWAPEGRQLMYSASSSATDWKPSLWIVDGSGDDIGKNRKHLNIQTWADKCSFADDETLYCAVPRTLPEGAGLQPEVADGTPDDIYRIDVTTGLQTLVAIPEGSHTVKSIMLAPDGKNLYFTDKDSGVLNKVQLK